MVTNAELHLMSVSELLDLNKRLIAIVKMKRKFEDKKKSLDFSVGDIIKINKASSKTRFDETFEIIKVNDATVKAVSKITGVTWNIPIPLLVLVKKVEYA